MPQTLYCQTHITQPIIKVSLQADAKQLLFCHECLENNKVPSLIDFTDFISTLHSQCSDMSHHHVDKKLLAQVNTLYVDEKILKEKFADQVGQYKERANTEIDAIEIQTNQLLHDVRAKTQQRFDRYETRFTESIDSYLSELETYKRVIGNIGKNRVTQDDLNNQIFSVDDTKTIEANLRRTLIDINGIKGVKEDPKLENITLSQNKLKAIAENTLVVPGKLKTDYTTHIDVLENYMKASMLEQEGKNDTNEAKDPENAGSESSRQKSLSKDLFQVLEGLKEKVEESSKEIEALLEKKYDVILKKEAFKCTVTKKGRDKAMGKAYRCITCHAEKAGYLGSNDVVCEGCFESCHIGHKLEYVDTREFVCQCQFTMGLECNLSVDCTFKYSGTSHVNQAYYRCTTDSMEYGRCLCGFCVKNCHKGHEYTFYSIGTAYCDCPSMYSFCKHKK